MADNIPSSDPRRDNGPTDRATFYGVEPREIAANNQVAIPKFVKHVLEDSQERKLILVRWQDEPYLRLYTKRQFDHRIDEVKRKTEFSRRQRDAAVRALSKAAVPIEPDEQQGRIVLPAKFVHQLGFKDKLVFCGANAYAEVWPAQAYQEDEAASQEALAPLREALTDILNE